ncbi:hypothetical protein DAPPUDRAFT_267711 [Daphnia pulex]|uniref:CCHC-type domain-containing protein n=1 Tax=Daphnia pulex TaxID=6669 RepID=E9HWV2_DAPPU|nr:hypothetical protein DAPPUDRAFT_267711 [Daphnia pulex]|eukprot:EFX63778.1 hypothetical protein DAPPUDRAFT_267711 [Daphnia pulex]
MEVLKVRLREFGTVLDLRQDRYAGATAGMIPCLTGQVTVRMTLNAAIPSYLQVGDYKIYVRYSNQPITCRECNQTGHMATACPQKLTKISPTVPTPSGKGVASIKGAAKVQAAKAPTTKEAPKLTTTNFPPLLPSEAAQWQTVTGRNKSRPSWEAENSCLVPETPENESTPMPSVNPSVVPETQEATPRDALAISVDTSSEGATSQISHIDTLSTVEDTLSESNDSGPDRDPQGQTRRKLPAFLSSIKRPLILVGDFNAVDGPQDRIRLAGTKPSTPVDHALVALVASLELVDMWKALRPRDLGHTFTHQVTILVGIEPPVNAVSSQCSTVVL